MYDSVYLGSNNCSACGGSHRIVKMDDQTVIKEFSYNYYIPNGKCSWSEDDRYCALVKWEDFCNSPNYYIDEAFNKRGKAIADKTKVKP